MQLHGHRTAMPRLADFGLTPVADLADGRRPRARRWPRCGCPTRSSTTSSTWCARRASTRASCAAPRRARRSMLAAAARARAALDGRDFVIPDDVKQLAAPALAHRVVLAPGAEIEGLTRRPCCSRSWTRCPRRADPAHPPAGARRWPPASRWRCCRRSSAPRAVAAVGGGASARRWLRRWRTPLWPCAPRDLRLEAVVPDTLFIGERDAAASAARAAARARGRRRIEVLCDLDEAPRAAAGRARRWRAAAQAAALAGARSCRAGAARPRVRAAWLRWTGPLGLAALVDAAAARPARRRSSRTCAACARRRCAS